MIRGGVCVWLRSVRMLVSIRLLRFVYTNFRFVSFIVTLREGSSKVTEGSGLDFITYRYCIVLRVVV